MAISSGMKYLKISVPSTLVATSFVFGGIVPDDVVPPEEPPIGRQVIVAAEPQRENQQAVVHAGVSFLLEEPRPAPLIVEAEPPPIVPQSTLLPSNLRLNERPELYRNIIVQAEPYRPAFSITLAPQIEEEPEEPKLDAVIVPPPEIPQAYAVTRGPQPEQPPKLDSVVVQAEPIPDAISITRGPQPEETPKLDSVIALPPEAQQAGYAVTLPSNLRLNERPELYRSIIVEAEPIPEPHVLTRGFAVPELLIGPLPEGKSTFTFAQPIPDAISFTLGGIVPDDVVVEEIPLAPLVIEAEPFRIQPQPVLVGLHVPETPKLDSVVISAEPLPEAISVTLSRQPDQPPKLDATIVRAQPVPPAFSVTLSPQIEEVAAEEPKRDSVTVFAEPVVQPPSFVQGRFTAADVVAEVPPAFDAVFVRQPLIRNDPPPSVTLFVDIEDVTVVATEFLGRHIADMWDTTR